jgi:hypothetical protein
MGVLGLSANDARYIVSLARPSLKNSVPSPSTIKATSAENKQEDEDDEKCGAIHGSLLRENELANLARFKYAGVLNSSSFQSPRPTFHRALS